MSEYKQEELPGRGAQPANQQHFGEDAQSVTGNIASLGIKDSYAQALQRPQQQPPHATPTDPANGPQQAPAQASAAAPLADPALWRNIPQESRDRQQWCIAAPDKAPKTIHGTDAKTNDPSTWNTFENVVNVASKNVQFGYGIGYVVSENDPFTFIDLDVKTPETHPDKPAKWTTPEQIARYEKILAAFPDTYAERSRSGLGWHIIVRGTTPTGKGINKDGVEIYPATHFLICTGNVLPGRPLEITDHQEMLTKLANEISKSSNPECADLVEIQPVLSDQQILNTATAASNGQKFLALWNCSDHTKLTVTTDSGNPYGSMSDVDDALLNFLAHYTQSNEQAHRLFLLSEPGKREKVRKRGREYTDRSFRKIRGEQQAINERVKLFKEQSSGVFNFTQEVPGKAPGYTVLMDDDLAALPRPKWIVKNLIPASGMGAIYGASQTYKSFLALDLLAHIAQGKPWFGFRVKQVPAVYVPFEGKGGVPKRVAAWRKASGDQDGSYPSTGIRFIMEATNLRDPTSRASLIAALKNIGPTGIVCIDTLAQAGPGIKENDSDGMGEMVALFQEIAEATGWVVLVVHHAGKNLSAGLRGHSSLEAAADFAIACYRTKEKEGENGNVTEEARTWFESYKVKDAESGSEYNFEMERVVLGIDEDGDEESSLVVREPKVTTPFMDQSAIAARAAKEAEKAHKEIQRNKEIDNAVWKYISDLWDAGKPPSKNYVESNAKAELADSRLSQIVVRNSLDRLEVEHRVMTEGSGPKSKLRAIDNAHLQKN